MESLRTDNHYYVVAYCSFHQLPLVFRKHITTAKGGGFRRIIKVAADAATESTILPKTIFNYSLINLSLVTLPLFLSS